jgi:cyclophilin family peptidyl-prolyl cis-trans isomerase
MPHSSKKYRKPTEPKSSRTPILVVVAVIVVIIAAAGGWYVYSSMKATTSTTLSSYVATTVTMNSQTQVTMNETLVNGTTYVMYAMMYTSKGNMELELYPKAAPLSVANFVNLARSGFYDDLLFHRIIPVSANQGIAIIQAGDPTTKNGGGNSSTWGEENGPVGLPLEIDPNLHNTNGTIALANTGAAKSSGSQFYINLEDDKSLDGSYTVFGRVINGMNVAIAISEVTPINSSTGAPESRNSYVFITNITILSNGPL